MVWYHQLSSCEVGGSSCRYHNVAESSYRGVIIDIMKVRIFGMLLVSGISCVFGLFISVWSLVLMIPVGSHTELLIELSVGLILLASAASSIIMQRMIPVVVINRVLLLILSFVATFIVWYVSRQIIDWSVTNYGAGKLSVQGHRIFQSMPVIGLGVGWIIACFQGNTHIRRNR